MKVLLVGEASVHYGLVASYLRAFQKLGMETLIFDPRKKSLIPVINSSRDKDHIISRMRRFITTHLNEMWADRLLKYYAKSGRFGKIDLAIIFKCKWLKPETLLLLKRKTQALLFHFNADSPFDKQKANSHPNLIKTIPLYDCYFIWHKGLIPKIYKKGAKRVEYLPFAWDPELHPEANPSPNREEGFYASDIAYIGNWTPERERWLSYITDMDLKIWGTYLWGRARDGGVKDKWTGYTPVGWEFAKVVRASKINLNFLRDQNKGSHNMRTFEVPGCGGFLLTERSEEQCEFFEEDKEIACFSTPEELREKIKFYLPRDELRRRMAEAAHRKVAQGHTYLDRAKWILEVYEEMR